MVPRVELRTEVIQFHRWQSRFILMGLQVFSNGREHQQNGEVVLWRHPIRHRLQLICIRKFLRGVLELFDSVTDHGTAGNAQHFVAFITEALEPTGRSFSNGVFDRVNSRSSPNHDSILNKWSM